MTTLTATFYDRANAERAIEDLKNAGIDPKSISVVMSKKTRDAYFGDEAANADRIAQAAAVGGAAGLGLGAILGGLWLTGVVVATGGIAAPMLIAGPVFGTLTGAAMGAALGSIAGSLVAAGVPQREADAIENDVTSGGTVLIAQVPDDQAATARDILRRDGGGVAPGTPAQVPHPI
ncbi:MAG: hypothetical protein JWN27_3444 [Candidatus Eremiobacteraeota bacterium]|nr:hypothetical protein [Candidatus Eremiobacteraeota bacterium]